MTPAGPFRAPRAGVLPVLLLALLAGSGAHAQARSLEYPVKAAFLYKFAAFVTWPSDAFTGPQSPVRVCVQGEDPFGAVLDRTVHGQRIGARPVVVRRLEAAGPTDGCHILYVAGSARQPVAEALAAVRGAPVLTVTDEARGATRGAVHFVIQDNRVRFHIDARAASANGLPVSSKLLSLAVSVRR